MAIKIILFDLDGTLLPMNQDAFVKTYFGLLAKKLANFGYEPEKLVQSVWAGTKAMVQNNSDKTNEAVFWDKFAQIYGEEARKDIVHFDEFYEQHFDEVRLAAQYNPAVPNVIKEIKNLGYRMALTTNPIFPKIATKKRIAWAGLSAGDFEYYTTYENCYRSKPNLEYYQNVIKHLDVLPEECLLVGNDVDEDMVASKIGINVFLLTDCMINANNKDISQFNKGNFDDLLEFIKNLENN